MKNIYKKPTVTVGIPAYNEEANVGYLISDLLKQNIKGFTLEKILIISDGSTDGTVRVIKKFNSKKIHFIDNVERQGLAKTQNEIFRNSESDILVLLNADIMINDSNFIKSIIEPIKKGEAEMTCSLMKELNQETFTGQLLNISMKFKLTVFNKFKDGNNLYTCHAVRAFERTLYKSIVFKSSIGEDAYSYLFTIYNNFRYRYVKSTIVFYRLPTNYKDHEKQSIRFMQSKKKFIKEFGEDFVNENYYLPLDLLIKTTIKFLARYPLHMFIYIFIYLGIKIKSLFATKINDNWDISKSSKVLRLKIL